jgi:hypothetical protein
MSFTMTMGNSRIDRIKLLQMEKIRNQHFRKTGIQYSKETQVPTIKKSETPAIHSKSRLNYVQCPYCKQQILNNNLHHHISFCRNAFKSNSHGKCTACELFRKK